MRAPRVRLVVLSISAALVAGDDARAGDDASRAVIVVDAGSTGTRLFKVEYEVRGKSCAFSKEDLLADTDVPLARSGDDALARMLAEQADHDPDVATLGIRVVATGGFRALDPGQGSGCGPRCSEKKRAVQESLRTAFPRAAIHVATGEEEAKLAWLTMKALRGDDAFAVVETGGSTVELAYPEGSGLRAVMARIGRLVVAEKVGACAPPVKDLEACLKGVRSLAESDPLGRELFATRLPAAAVIGMGGLHNLPRLLGHDNPFKHLESLEALAREACAESGARLRGEGADAETARKRCSKLALDVVLVDRFRISEANDADLEVGAAFAPIPEFAQPKAAACANLASRF